jgi:hypothetical protein
VGGGCPCDHLLLPTEQSQGPIMLPSVCGETGREIPRGEEHTSVRPQRGLHRIPGAGTHYRSLALPCLTALSSGRLGPSAPWSMASIRCIGSWTSRMTGAGLCTWVFEGTAFIIIMPKRSQFLMEQPNNQIHRYISVPPCNCLRPWSRRRRLFADRATRVCPGPHLAPFRLAPRCTRWRHASLRAPGP